MAEIKVEGMEQFIELLIATEKQTDRIIGRSIYPGAKIVAEKCKDCMKLFIVTETGKHAHKAHYPTPKQLEGLIESMGIAKILRKFGGTFDVKLGFDGYNKVKTKKHPTGQPNAMIARSINSGSSYMIRQPFMDQTIRLSKDKAEAIIGEQFDKELEKFWSRQGGGKLV